MPLLHAEAIHLKTFSLSRQVIRDIRIQLFGEAERSLEIISDHALIRFLLAACGVYCGSIDPGYEWRGDSKTKELLISHGLDVEAVRTTRSYWCLHRSWLDNAVALATGQLQPVDSYYQVMLMQWGNLITVT